MVKNKFSENTLGIIYGFLAFTIWGFLPLYWKALDQVPADEILAHRIFWSFVFIIGILFYSKHMGDLKRIYKDKKLLGLIILSSLILSFNWYTFIWGVNSGYVVEVSLGYYINPLVVIFMGIIILKEKCNIYQYIAIGLAFIGVCIMTVQYGHIPWIAVILAISFALYGLMKKLIKVEATLALAVETTAVMPIALGYIIFKQMQGTGHFLSGSTSISLLLLFCGLATAIPLLLFAKGTQRINFSTIGFLQYIAPTINLYLGIFVFKEQFTQLHLVSFSFIWLALIIYSLSKTNLIKKIGRKNIHISDSIEPNEIAVVNKN